MSALILRGEFCAKHMRGTAIELCNKQNTGWAQRGSPDELLDITYPTADIQRALEAISTDTGGRPVLFQGQRGRGKSHIMAVLHYAFSSPQAVETWAREWATKLGSQRLAALNLPRGFAPISETLSNQEYACLWDVIFDRHPRGQYYRGRFEQSGTSVPSKPLLQDLFAEQHTALILDEWQIWFDGKHDDAGDTGLKRRQWAFNFIQILTELARDRPDLLMVIASVRDNTTDAYRQIHRVSPLVIDFKGETARDDRKRLVLHRLFENRTNFGRPEIERLTEIYASERNRLLYADRTDADQAALSRDVVESWPFSPELLNLLEDRILMSAAAQDNRDSIRILAEVFRARGDSVPVITPADFSIDQDDCGVVSLIDSFATTADQERLREKACRNLDAIRDAQIEVSHAQGAISSLWIRSLSTTQDVGGTRAEVQLDLTRDAPLDDNAFTEELATIVDNSFNIHQVGVHEKRFCFKLPENPVSKLKAWARNDRYFDPDTPTAPGLQPIRRDQKYLQDVVNYVLKSTDSATEQPCHPIVLDPNWERSPWANVQTVDQPSKWAERGAPVLLVIPVCPDSGAEAIAQVLGPWLAINVPVNRNMVRFLLPKASLPSLYDDRDLLITTRCALLAREWKDSDPLYSSLHKRFEGELKSLVGERFDKYALLGRWDFQNPSECTFHVEPHGAIGSRIPAAVEAHIREHYFAPEDFERQVIEAAARCEQMKQLLAVLRSEPLPGAEAVPYLGETASYEHVLKVAARYKIALNVNGTWLCRNHNESEDDALRRLRSRGWRTGRELQEVQLGTPEQAGSAGVTVPATHQTGLFDGPRPAPVVTPPAISGGSAGPVTTHAGTNGSAHSAGDGESFGTLETGAATAESTANPVIHRSLGAKSGINLLGDLERWALPDQQRVTQADLTFHGLSIRELRELCARLPSKTLAELQITLPPDESARP
jgi:hypothetical protein